MFIFFSCGKVYETGSGEQVTINDVFIYTCPHSSMARKGQKDKIRAAPVTLFRPEMARLLKMALPLLRVHQGSH